VNSAKTELQVQKELDKKRFLTSAPHGRGTTPYTPKQWSTSADVLDAPTPAKVRVTLGIL